MTSTPSSAAHRRDPPDVGLLDAALARSRSSAFGEDAYPTLELKAAALLHSLVGNHALVDGNERLGWLATVVFLVLNRSSPLGVPAGWIRNVPGTADRDAGGSAGG